MKDCLDDIVVASKNKEEHIRLLHLIFKVLDHYQLKLTLKKIKIAEPSIEFLGYLIKDGKRYPTVDKIETIKNWKIPITMKDWYSFIGFVNFLSSFIPNCALLLKPLYQHHTCLKKKQTSTVSTELLQNNFELLKKALIKSVGLRLFNPNEIVYILTDASDLGVGGMLLQKSKDHPKELVPISYFSKSFSPTQQRYATLERELLGILLALTSNYLLLSDKIIVYTDHKALVSINQKNSMLNTRILKYLETLSTYPLEIKYISGKKNCADFISRFWITAQPVMQIEDSHLNSMAVRFSPTIDEETLFNDSIFKARSILNFNAVNDAQLLVFKQLLSHSEQELDRLEEGDELFVEYDQYKDIIKNFKLIDNTLYYLHFDKLLKVISTGDCFTLFESAHQNFHGTPNLLLDIMVQKKVFHPQAQLLAIETVKNCANCDLFTRFQELPALMQQVKTPQFGEIWHIDFVGPLEPADAIGKTNCRYLLVAVEYVSGYCVATAEKAQNSHTVTRFLNNLFTYFPLAKTIVSDNGSPFKSELTSNIKSIFKLEWKYTSVYYPQANSKVERVNGLINKFLKSFDPTFKGWSLFLSQSLRCYNNSTTIFDTSPSELVFGYSHFDIIGGSNQIEKNVLNFLQILPLETDIIAQDALHLRQLMIYDIRTNRNLIADRKHQQRKMLKILNDPQDNHNCYSVGEFVYVKKLKKRKKTDPSFDGPFIISQVFDKNSYKLKDLQGNIKKNTYNLIHLRPCFQHYGSPMRSIADFSQTLGDQERQLFRSTFTIENS